jgi:CelD/BcsL family acetyltransferase involved in cellulose biosynthesis
MESGLTEYDFLRGTETYKSDWVSKQRRTVSVRVHSGSMAGRWFSQSEELARNLRNGAKAMMPDTLVEKVRRLRRRRAAVH